MRGVKLNMKWTQAIVRILALLCLASASLTVAHALEIKVLDSNNILKDGPVPIFMSGDVLHGDATRLQKLDDNLKRAVVFLRGPGGEIDEALTMGAEIRLRGYSTNVLSETECLSACAIIWLSGVRRYMSKSSRIGFHGAYRVQNGVACQMAADNAELGSFMTHLGLSVAAIKFLVSGTPTELHYLTLDDAHRLGIPVYEQRGKDVIPPVHR